MYVCYWSDNAILYHTCTDLHLQIYDSFIGDLHNSFKCPRCMGFDRHCTFLSDEPYFQNDMTLILHGQMR